MGTPALSPETEQLQPMTPAPVVTPVVVTPAAELIVREYQPEDADGRPLGAKQVFKGATEQEVFDKVARAHQEAIRALREQTRRNRMGEYEQDSIPTDAPRFDTDYLELTPRTLDAAERMQLSRDLSDPEKVQDAIDRAFEARFGAKPEVVSKRINKAQQDAEAVRAKSEGDAFVSANPDYFVCPKNFQTIANWMIKNGLAPVRQNFQLAYDTLNPIGLLDRRPIVREELPSTRVETPVNTPPELSQPSRITSAETAQPRRSVQEVSGLTRSEAGDGNLSAKDGSQKTLTVAEIERMPSNEYRQKMSDPAFCAEVNRAYAEFDRKNAERGFQPR